MSNLANFEPGAVVVPARDGLLFQLGYDLDELDLDALGVVIERGSRRALVNFPEIAKTLWLDFVELADIEEQSLAGVAEYAGLLPKDALALKGERLVWIMSWLMKRLALVEVLDLEMGTVEEVWDPCQGEQLSQYFAGDDKLECCRLSLGLSAFSPDQQKLVGEVLGGRLLFLQTKPAGMHKFEVAFYLSRHQVS